MNEHVKPAFDLEALQEQLAALRRDIEGLTATLAAGVDQTRTRAKKAAAAAGPALAEQAREQVHASEQALEHAMRDRPLMALLIAAAVGFLIGALVHR